MKLILSRVIKPKGQAAALLNLFLAIGAVALIAVLCFELSRYLLARDELKTSTEAAALCCETALVSSGDPTDTNNQGTAVSTALSLFAQNSILGVCPSQTSAITAPSDLAPDAGQAQICFQFLNPVTRAVMTSTSPGALIQATGAYCYAPEFGKFLGLGNAQFTFQVSAFSGVPRIDVVLAFDVSGAMDDETPVSPIQRWGSTGPGSSGPGGPGGTGNTAITTSAGNCYNPLGINYEYANTNTNGTSQAFTGGTITQMLGYPGLALSAGITSPNALPPQYLEGTVNYTGAPVYSQQASQSTYYLAGYDGNNAIAALMHVPPGNVCICNLQPTPPPGGPGTSPSTSYLNNKTDRLLAHRYSGHKKSRLIASHKSPETDSKKDLQQICAAINGNKRIKNQVDYSQLDANLSNISFVPQFYAYPGMPLPGAPAPGTPEPPYVSYYGTTPGTFAGSSHTGGAGSGTGDNNYAFTVDPDPGYCPATSPYSPSTVAAGPSFAQYFTDMDVNVDGKLQYVGNYVSPLSGAQYFDMGTVVEAARGNLESATYADAAFVDTKGMYVKPASGWAADYSALAQLQLQPLNDLLNAATAFVHETENVADAHFSFIAFNDNVNANASSTPPTTADISQAQYSSTAESGYYPMVSSWSVDPYPAPTTSSASNTSTYIKPPLAFIPLNPSAPSSSDTNPGNLDLITTLPSLRPYGNRNVALAIQAAIAQFKANGRPGANRAIVIFTDGPPTTGVVDSNGSSALTDAQTAGADGIAIYCVCVADPNSTATITDDSADDTAYGSGGICAASANATAGPRYYRIDWPAATSGTSSASAAQIILSGVVDNVVRQMVGTMH